MCWILLIIVSFGIIIPGHHLNGIKEHIINCVVYNSGSCTFITNIYYVIICSALTILTPGLLIFFFNVRVLIHVRQQSSKRKYVLTGGIRPRYQNNRNGFRHMRITRTIAVLTGGFFICWLPYVIVNVMSSFVDYQIQYFVDKVVLWLG